MRTWRKKRAWIVPHLPSGTLVSSGKHQPGLGSIASSPEELVLKSPCSLLSQQQKALLSFAVRSVLCTSHRLEQKLSEDGSLKGREGTGSSTLS